MKTRITGPVGSYYHVFSRIVERRFYLGYREKEVFRDMMWRVAEFSGIKIVTYCIMDNHFHLLIQVPKRVAINDDELFRRLNILYGQSRKSSWNDPLGEFERSADDPVWRNRLRNKYQRRMYDLSEFMRTLKLRYSFWFNRNHDRIGSLWDARFRSVLIDGNRTYNRSGFGNLALVTVAAYIDLNCVRAGIVDDPKDYRWCGYGEALGGNYVAQKGIVSLYSPMSGEGGFDWPVAVNMYRSVLVEKGGIGVEVLNSTAVLRCRVRYFTRGAILGSKAFVDSVFQQNRSFFAPDRKTGARAMKKRDWGELYAARHVP